jgi:hypothetical protein
MGGCMSTNAEDLEQKKRSQAIDRKLEEDSRKLRRECKILLLGMLIAASLAVVSMALISSQVPVKVVNQPSLSR